MVERVALAMQEACEGPAGDFDKRPHKTYVKCARVAIAAMRDPTVAMQEVGYGPDPRDWNDMFPIGVWTCMIDEALK
jgi:hypothetical protein